VHGGVIVIEPWIATVARQPPIKSGTNEIFAALLGLGLKNEEFIRAIATASFTNRKGSAIASLAWSLFTAAFSIVCSRVASITAPSQARGSLSRNLDHLEDPRSKEFGGSLQFSLLLRLSRSISMLLTECSTQEANDAVQPSRWPSR
jgi:hypothetical protein